MAADWEEVKRLAADFQRAQLTSTVQRLSERNCIEIVKKLIESKLIEVIFTIDGKDYLTPNRLLKEIKDELYVHGGRINLVDLAQIIKVDYNHVESKANEFVSSEPNVHMVLGQIITKEYMDNVAEEINEKLHQTGQLSIVEIIKTYDLPDDFLEQSVRARLGTIIHGEIDKDDSTTIFTESFVAQNKAKIRGALSALTRPVPLSSLINHFKFPEKLVYRVADEMIKEGRLAGSLSGGRADMAIFIPEIYSKTQSDWIHSFYRQNNYLEYDAVSRLGISDARSYLKKLLKDETGLTFLPSCCVGKNIVSQLEAVLEEALHSNTYVDVWPHLPSVFTPDDCKQLITTVTNNVAKQDSVVHVYNTTVVMSDGLMKTARASFESLMETKAKEDVTKNPQLFAVQQSAQSSAAKKESGGKSKSDRKEDKKKKTLTGGKSGGGTQGRETKTKSVKKKYFTSRDADEDACDDIEASGSSFSSREPELQFMDVRDIERHLKKLECFEDCPEELTAQLAEELHWPLTRRYREVAKAFYESSVAMSGSSRRKQHADYQEKFSSLLSHIIVFEKGAKLFADDVASQLLKHLLKTLCSDLTNAVILLVAQENGIALGSESESMTPEQRQKLLNKFPDNMKQPLTKLHSSLNAKNLEDFHTSIDIVLGAGICDMIVRKPDKKKERLLLSAHRQSLLSQLQEAAEPALCLHLATLLVFQTHTHHMLHASGKFVPHLVTYLQKNTNLELYQLMAAYQESVIKKLTPSESEEERRANETFLQDMMPKVKEAAVTYRKTSVSESTDN